MKNPTLQFILASLLLPLASHAATPDYAALTAAAKTANAAPVATQDGKFQPTWASLQQYETPEWFRDAKFGIWAHWGPQCEPEQGDWYARNMWTEIGKDGKPHPEYTYHLTHYGPQSKVGFKDVIHEWKAKDWVPAKLMQIYKRAGAQYFMALANHHDNLDLWDSKYQPWNSVNVGPQKDLIGGWAKAARAEGLRFGVSVHAARTWSWYEPAQGADTQGPYTGIPYDGKTTAADGKGKWWDGLDPQELYAQNHEPKAKADDAYKIKFFNRTIDLINQYQPDMVYFDDSVMPISSQDGDWGLKIASHFYNSSMLWHDGKNEAVVTTKGLSAMQRKCVVYDIERGRSDHIEPLPWQTDTCIGDWHYSRALFDRHGYKKITDVIPLLIDVVSKNGNLMLSVPLNRDGVPDSDELAFLEKMTAWMDIHKEGIFATRPWKIYGEGPSTAQQEKGHFGGLKDTGSTPFTPEDIRFTTSKDGGTLYAFFLAWPKDGKLTIKSLAEGGTAPALLDKKIASLSLLGSTEKITWTQDADGLHATLPATPVGESACALRLTLR